MPPASTAFPRGQGTPLRTSTEKSFARNVSVFLVNSHLKTFFMYFRKLLELADNLSFIDAIAPAGEVCAYNVPETLGAGCC